MKLPMDLQLSCKNKYDTLCKNSANSKEIKMHE